MRQLFIDLDGVLADFDGYYFDQFGIKLDSAKEDGVANPDGMFDRINAHGSFFADLPKLKDADDIWESARLLHPKPIILTGVAHLVDNCEEHKIGWVKKHIDPEATVICCPSAYKYKHGKPGDVLIDDWNKYRPNWEAMGGIFILHRNAKDSFGQAMGLFLL